jgi:DNA-binding CsgD family transcriptional regulator
VPNTRHTLLFDVPIPPSTATHLAHHDKNQLCAKILSLRAEGLSYRAIGEALGLHWTRVGQIMKNV